LIQQLGNGEPPIIICDHALIHRSELVKDFLEELQGFILYLPPYSPQLNPIDLIFSKWKCEMKVPYKPFTSQGVMDAITEASNEISSKNCRNWIHQVERFRIKALRCEPFLE
jgi:transposase